MNKILILLAGLFMIAAIGCGPKERWYLTAETSRWVATRATSKEDRTPLVFDSKEACVKQGEEDLKTTLKQYADDGDIQLACMPEANWKEFDKKLKQLHDKQSAPEGKDS